MNLRQHQLLLHIHCLLHHSLSRFFSKKTSSQSNAEKDFTEKVEWSVQLTGRQTKKGKVSIMDELTVEKTKYAYFREAMTQVGMSGSKFHVDHNGLLVQTSTIDGCLQKLVPISFGEHILHVEHCPPVVFHTQVSQECMTRCEQNFAASTWRVSLIRRYAAVQHVRVIANRWNANYTSNCSPRCNLSILLL